MFTEKIKVANVRSYKPNEKETALYCGRGTFLPFITVGLGNPFTVEKFGRDVAIQEFAKVVREPNSLVMAKIKLVFDKYVKDNRKDIVLLCWCKPNACHCDVIKYYMDLMLDT